MTKDLKFTFTGKSEVHPSPYQNIWKQHYIMPNGQPKSFEVKHLAETAVILPLTPDHQVVCVSQYRPGPDMVLTELPAGFVDNGEAPLQAAQRELLEETGYTGDLQYIGKSFVDAYSTAIRHVFIARDCEKVSEQNLDSSEFIEVKLIQLETFREICLKGQITHGESAFIALANLEIKN